MPLRFYAGTFSLTARRLRLPVAAGAAPLTLRLARPVPYEADQVRSVTLDHEGGRLHVDVTAEVPIADHDLDPDRVAGVDLGIIHPYAVAGPEEALIVSGRGLRAEARLHLADTKGRQRVMARRAPSPGRAGSRRWRKMRAHQRRVEARHRRRLRQAHHEAARTVVAWAADRRLGTLVVGDLRGITATDAGRRHNLALRSWRPAHLLGALRDKAEVAGMGVLVVDERGTSSTCPRCSSKVSKPKGRVFFCPRCGHGEHRDVVGARNIAARGGGSTSAPALVMHRRAGRYLPGRTRRDPRRVRMDARSGLWPAVARSGAPESRSSSTLLLGEEPLTSA
jgi:putative transposase